jgi:protein transport protein SEC61 subunit gamma and related proteins
MIQKLNSFIAECKRVLMVTKKPDKQEYSATTKVAGLGILVIGAIGFLLFVLKEILF